MKRRDSRQRTEERSKGQPQHGFEFRDRSGKVHGGGAKGSGAPSHVARPESKPKKQGGPAQREQRGGAPEAERGSRGRGFKGERKSRPHRQDFGPAGATLKATVDKNRKGFGFLVFENRQYEDAFIPPREAERLFHGDRVEVRISGRGQVEALQVLEHRFRELVGRYAPHPASGHRSGWVVYERKRAREEIFVPRPDPAAQAGDWVRARLHFEESGPHPVKAEITQVYGPGIPASADLQMVASEYNLIEEHSSEAEREARSMTLQVPGRDLEGREDLRGVPFITIDGETARDFDDAVYVERSRAGFILWVAIADVSHYVTDGSALDKEARSRGTSVYFPERAFHMLPRALSENLCSLKPREPRLAMVARIECDSSGSRLGTRMMDAVIESRRRATYEQVEAEFQANRGSSDWEYAPHFDLYRLLRKLRAERGSIDFDLPEAELRVDPQGEVLSITRRSRLDSHRLIEEFMIAANEAVTDWMLEKGWPFVYRVHDEPAEDALARFQKLAATMGVHLKLDSASRVNLPRVMADLVRRLDGHPAQAMLNMALLRSLKQAVYSSVHSGHFGLASVGYTHFTSPIRRYPDLVVHRLLRRALRVEQRRDPPLNALARELLEKELAEICEHCSYRERLASDAEREAVKLKQVRAMIPHVGEEFDGEVVGIVDSGLFVSLENPYSEGLLDKDTMGDDFYEFDEDRMVFQGARTRRQFRIGDEVRIRVLRADLDRRQIDFGMVELGRPARPGAREDEEEPVRTRGSRERGKRKGKFR